MRNRRFVPFATAVLAMALAGCTAGTAQVNTVAVPEPSAGGTDAPVGLDQFYGQQLAWSGCQDFTVAEYQERSFASSRVQCARLTVPLDYQNTGPGAPTVTLGVLRAPAARPDQRIGTAMILPTEDGLGMDLATYVSGNGDEFSNRFDVVGFDRRGVGASAPAIECLSAADVDRARASTTRTRNDAEVAAADAETAEFAAACLRNSAAGSGLDPAEFLAHAGSREAVQDVEVLRAVLGAPTLSVLGYGYGARAALAYATGHPDRVRAMVLDSPRVTSISAAETLAWAQASQAAFDQFTHWCVAGGACSLGNDPGAAQQTYRSLVVPLIDEPMPLRGGSTGVLTFDEAIQGTVAGLATTENRTQLAVALRLLAGGNPDALHDMADRSWGLLAGEYPFLAAQSISCIDGTAEPTGEAADQLAVAVAAAAPFMASTDPARGLDSVCTTWPSAAGFTNEPFAAVPTPTLVTGFAGDLSYPFSRTAQLAQDLRAPLLTVQRTGSGAFLLNGGSCVDVAGTAFLVDPATPAESVDCP